MIEKCLNHLMRDISQYQGHSPEVNDALRGMFYDGVMYCYKMYEAGYNYRSKVFEDMRATLRNELDNFYNGRETDGE